MNAQIQTYIDAQADKVVGVRWPVAQKLVNGQLAKGYSLLSPTGGVLAVIETLGPDSRLEELLRQYTAPPVYLTARELMRDLLNAEDYRSTIYDNIVRVHYEEDFAKPEKQTNV